MSVPRKPPSVSPPVQVQTQQQPRGPQHHFATRGQTPPIPYRQLSQEEFQRNQVYQQQFSGFAAGNTTHDHMNKQQMQTHVPGPGQSQAQAGLQQQVMYQAQQHQGGQPRPGTPGGNAALGGAGYPPVGGAMYHNPGAAQLGPSTMEEGGVSFTIPRQTVPQSMRGGQQRQPLTMASSPGTLYNNPVHTTMYVQGQPPPPYIPGQHQVIIQQGPPPPLQVPPQYQGARTMPASFTITTSQPNYGMPQPTHNFYNPQAGNGGYFMSATPTIVPQQTQRPMDQPQQQQPAQPYQKRKRNIIRITDPNTGRDISDEIMSSGTKSNTPPQSGPNSARATPVSGPPGPPSGVGPATVAAYSPNATPPPPAPQPKESQVDIAAQFAAQVAATLSQKTSQQQRQQPPQLPPQQQVSMQQQVTQHPQQVAQPAVAVVAQEPTPAEVKPAATTNDSEAEPSHERSASREPSQPREVSKAAEPAVVVEETVVKPQVAVPVTITPPTPEATQKKAEVQAPPEPKVVAEKVEEKVTEEVREKEVEVEKEQDSKATESQPQKEVTKAPSEPREVSRGPSEPRDAKRGPSEQREAKRVPSEPLNTKRGPSEPRDAKRGPSEPRDAKRGPSEPRDAKRGPSEPRDAKRGPSEPRDAKRGPSEPRDVKRGPSEPRDVKRVPSETRDAKPQEVKQASVEPRDVPSEVSDSDKPKATAEGRATPESDTAAKDDAKEDFKEVEGKDKRKSKKKLKEQNHKGDSKEGSDMDTPNVPAATAAATPEPPQPTPTQQPPQQPPQEQQQQTQPQKSREQTPEVVTKVEKEKTPEPEPTKPTVVRDASPVVRDASPAPTPAPTPAQPPAPNNKEKEEEASLDKVEIKVVEDEKVAEKNEKNEETRRRVLPPQDDLWRKSNNTNSTNMDAPWRKSPAVAGEEDLWRKPASEKLNEEPPKKVVVESKPETTENNEAKDSDKTNSSSNISDSNTPVIDKDGPELKYQYKEGQWSPANQDGRKAYDRNFLLQMQYSSEGLEKPDGLPRLPDVILDKPLPRNEPRSGGGGGMNTHKDIDFTPGFVKSTQAKGGSQSMGRSRSQQKNVGGKDMMGGMGGPGGAKRIISISRDLMDTRLHTTANAWKPGQQKKLVQGDSETQELLSVMRSILNKLTPQKFQVLLKQIQGLKLDNPEKLRGTIDLVFEKAIDEPAFSSTYANLCRCMNSLKVPVDEKATEFINFRKLLLVRCQAEFEKDKTDELDSEQRQGVIDEKEKELKEKGTSKELEDAIKLLKAEKMMTEAKARRRTLGNIRFIGELFKLGILNETIMHNCITKLLGQNDEDSLECLCKLLMTIGKNLDSDDKAKGPKVDAYFKKLTQISQDKKISARIRFMIQDVLDLRKDKWVPRRDDNAPKTIDELHKEIQQEDQQKAQMIANITSMPMPKHGGGGGHDRGRRGRGPGGGMDDGGWTPVAKPLRNTQSIEPGRMKITKQNFDNDNIQLGPSSSYSGWGRGSTGGGAAGKSREQNKGSLSLNTPNKYEALSRHSDSRRDGFESSGRSESTGRGGMASRERERDRDSRDSRDSKGGWSQPKSKFGARSSQDDREAALSAVSKSLGGVSRNMMAGQRPSTTPTGSRNQSMEGSRREGTREREPAPAPATPELSDAEIRRKTKALMDEYLGILDPKEALACVKELESPSKMHIMVSTALNHVIEKNKAGRQNTGQLLARLVTAKLVTPADYIKGLDDVVEFAEDMAIDIPKIYAYMAEVVAPMVDSNTIELTLLAKAFAPLQSSGKAGALMAEVLNDAVTRKDEKSIGEMWAASGLNWSDLLGKDDVNEFAQRYKVEYTLTSDRKANSTVSAPEESGKLSMKQIQDQLDLLITEKKAKDEEVFQWVMTNVGDRCREPAFVRALMTSVCTSAISGSTSSNMKVDNAVVISRSAMLMKYLDHKPQLELQGLYALQALVHRLDHPAGILRNFFDVLYDEDIISEDAFTHWETSTDAAEQAGKGVALKSVVQFFTWLREADEESPDDN